MFLFNQNVGKKVLVKLKLIQELIYLHIGWIFMDPSGVSEEELTNLFSSASMLFSFEFWEIVSVTSTDLPYIWEEEMQNI